MNFDDLLLFLPELTLILGALALFGCAISKRLGRHAGSVTMVTAALCMLAIIAAWDREGFLFFGSWGVGAINRVLQLAIGGAFLLVTALTLRLPDVREEIRPEYFLFTTIHVFGLFLLIGCVDAIALVVALECVSFPLYLLVAMRRERPGQRTQMESTVKYIMFGVMANGLMLFGFGYLYGLTGTTNLPLMLGLLKTQMGEPLAMLGLALVFCGFLNKLVIFPFHFWTPDVYQGASNETAALVSTLPKIGALAVLARLVVPAMPDNTALALLLTLLAAASLLYGNLGALGQEDFKRLLAYSGIAHGGFFLLGFIALSTEGNIAALFSAVTYPLMLLACFTAVTTLAKTGENLTIADFTGLHKRSPLLALTLAAGIFGLAGIPPFVGFIGKLALVAAAVSSGHILIAVVAVLASAVAAYYYLRVIQATYLSDPAPEAQPITLDLRAKALCVALIILNIGLGIFPQILFGALGGS